MNTDTQTILFEEAPPLASLDKLSKDLKKAAATLSPQEARFLVDIFYTVQNYRIRFANQIRALAEAGEPHDLIRWMYTQVEGLEGEVKKSLDTYSLASEVGRWMRSLMGIGPVIAAGYLAHIDIHKAPTAGHIWSFSGVAVGQVWNKGEKRPWNAKLKRLNFLTGESFIKVQSRPRDVYGKVFAERKKLEQEANEYYFYAPQAEEILRTKKLGKETDAFEWYSKGMLPPAHIHARARRYAVKIFLGHLQQVWWESEFHEKPAAPYVVAHLGHIHASTPPNWPPETAEQVVAHNDDLVQQGVDEVWPGSDSEEVTMPRTPLALTLQLQIMQFKEVLDKVEQLQLPAATMPLEEFQVHPQLLQTIGAEALAPTLATRIQRFKAQSQRIINK